MKNSILSAKDLCKSFALSGGQVHILQHVDLELYEGDFTVIMGASGSGKSTLLYALSGMDRATSGEVTFNGEDIVKMKERGLSKLRSGAFGRGTTAVRGRACGNPFAEDTVRGRADRRIEPKKYRGCA